MTARRYRAALLGLGSISRAHQRGYTSAANAARIEIVAGADPSNEARDRFAAETGAATYAHFSDLLERERPDFVSICTWPPLHPEMVEAAAGSSVKGILCEKPMAVDLAGCDRMLAAAERSGTVLAIGHQRRLQPKFTRARALIEAGAIGTLELLCGIAAGDLLSDGTHTVDLLRFLTGALAVEWVMGSVDLRRREIRPEVIGRSGFALQERPYTVRYGHPVESGAVATLQFASSSAGVLGPRATLELGLCARPGYQRFLVYGTDGAIRVSGDRAAEDEPLLHVRRKGAAGWELIEGVEETNGFAREIALLLDSIEQGSEHPLNARSARRTHEVLMAVFESARRPGRVELPLDLTQSPLEDLLPPMPASAG
jgi:predicted dehydrogenase